ncbi:MAG: DUF58 domain-containing protein [Ghiorsea sp.]
MNNTPSQIISATQLNLTQLIAMQQQVAKLAVRRKHIRSAMSGQHLSKLRGRGMEFDEVRVYQAGDEVASIDWKVTARTGTTHTKVFREERERPVFICLDYRQSMFFATRGVLKSVLATQAAALLAWHGIAHGDRLGGLLFSDTAHHEIKPCRGKKGVLKLLHRCSQDQAWQARRNTTAAQVASFTDMCKRLRRVSKPGSLIYILSDFRGLNAEAESHLLQLARHHDVLLISIHDIIEKAPPTSGAYPVFDGQAYFTCQANKKLQAQLSQQYQHRFNRLQTLQNTHGLQHIPLETTDDVALKIREHLWTV